MTTRIGSVDVDRVLEWVGPIKTVDDMFPDTPGRLWTDELAPHHWTPSTRSYRAAIQTWVLRSAGRVILDHLHTDYLHHLAEIGVQPPDVDIVINTHIHYDHVGWNTRLVGATWTPTFPNATYLVPAIDYDYFHPDNAQRMRPPRTEDEQARFDGIQLVFEDSIVPIHQAGQLETWRIGHRIDENLRVEPAPGHTPGSSVAWLEPGAGAVVVGDLIHTPLQINRPGDACLFDIDADEARTSQQALLEAAARTGAAVFPAHFAGHGATTITPKKTNFDIDRWLPFPAI